MKKFIFNTDKHIGRERKGGKLVPVHDTKAINAVMEFARDFKPDVWIEGGDDLDCGPVSHWLKDKALASKDLDLRWDVDEYCKLVLHPLDEILAPNATRIKLTGNHEEWLNQLAELHPGLASLLDQRHLMDLRKWTLVPQGGYTKLGKLHFIHGDQLKGGARVAMDAVTKFEHSIRFGHFHTYQVATKHSMLDAKDVKTGVAVPAMCKRNPNFLKGAPSQWVQGFNYGYIHPDGTFSDYVPIIVNGKFFAEGRAYKG